MNLIAIPVTDVLDPPAAFRPPNAITGEVTPQGNDEFAIKITYVPPSVDGEGDWLSLDSQGNWHRRSSIGQDERFKISTIPAAWLVAAGRGSEPVPAFLFAFAIWAE